MSAKQTLTQRSICRMLFCLIAAGGWASAASGELITFRFEGELIEDFGPRFALSVGQRVSGSYSFELGTSLPTDDFDNSFTAYNDVVTNFELTVHGFGTASSSNGSILLGNPVQTIGSFQFLSDQYVVFSEISGITIPDPTGDLSLIDASMRLTDLDMEALDTEHLSAMPPDLGPFLDNTGPNYDSDNAQLVLNLRTPFNAISSAPFRVTSLAASPEPSGLLLSITGLALCARQRRR